MPMLRFSSAPETIVMIIIGIIHHSQSLNEARLTFVQLKYKVISTVVSFSPLLEYI